MDEAVLWRARAGDHAAFEAIVAEHGAFVLRLALSLTRHRADAEDVHQRVFLKLYRYLPAYDPTRELGAYLRRITIHEAYSVLRARRADVPLEAMPEPVEPPEDIPSRLDGALLAARVRELLPLLTPRERTIFVLKELEGLPTGEIAESLGINEVTVRRFLGLARRRLLLLLRDTKAVPP